MRKRACASVMALTLIGCSLANAFFGQSDVKSGSERTYRNDFVRAMREVEEERERAARRKSLMERILQLAQRVTSPGDRRLENDAQYFKYEDVNDWNVVENLESMAIKYTACQNIKKYDDYMAMNDDESPLRMDRFVTFRLCQADSCSAYNKRGCDYNFGEYMIPMEDYLGLMAEYHFQQFSRYCKTCYHCMQLDYYNPAENNDQDQAAADDDDGAVMYGNASDAYDNSAFGDDYWAGTDVVEFVV